MRIKSFMNMLVLSSNEGSANCIEIGFDEVFK